MGPGFESLKVHQKIQNSFYCSVSFILGKLIQGLEGREVGGFYRRPDSPRLGLSAVRVRSRRKSLKVHQSIIRTISSLTVIGSDYFFILHNA